MQWWYLLSENRKGWQSEQFVSPYTRWTCKSICLHLYPPDALKPLRWMAPCYALLPWTGWRYSNEVHSKHETPLLSSICHGDAISPLINFNSRIPFISGGTFREKISHCSFAVNNDPLSNNTFWKLCGVHFSSAFFSGSIEALAFPALVLDTSFSFLSVHVLGSSHKKRHHQRFLPASLIFVKSWFLTGRRIKQHLFFFYISLTIKGRRGAMSFMGRWRTWHLYFVFIRHIFKCFMFIV